jgi:hypothetical protein
VELILKIVAGVVLGGLLLILLGYFAIKLLFWRLKRNLNKALGDLKGLTGDAAPIIQTSVDLQPDDELDLSREGRAAVEQFTEAGFEPAGTYQAAGGVMQLALFAPPADRVWGAVTDSSITPGAADIVSQHVDGRWITHTTGKDLGLQGLDGITKIRVPDATVPELLSRHLAERPEGEHVEATAGNAVGALKRAVRDDGLLRAWRGGIDDKEVQKNLHAIGDDTDDGQATYVMLMARHQAAGVLDTAFEEAFREQTTLPVARWEQIEDRLLIVHPLSDAEELGAALHGDEADDDAFPAEPGGESVRHRFAEANNKLPPGDRLEHLETIELQAANRILRADVYVTRDDDLD